jgi:hypothetical protein
MTGTHFKNMYIFSILKLVLAPRVSSVGIKALTELRHLKQFLFGELGPNVDWEVMDNWLLLCARFLPNLRIAGLKFADPNNMRVLFSYLMINGEESIGSFFHDRLARQREPCRIGFEELIVSGDVNFHKESQVPNLRALHLCYLTPDNLAGRFSRFSNISELGIYSTDAATTIKVLQVLGQNLSQLSLRRIRPKFSLLRVLQLCPNLKQLHTYLCEFDFSDGVWPIELLSCLEDLQIIQTYGPLPWKFIVNVNNLYNFLFVLYYMA